MPTSTEPRLLIKLPDGPKRMSFGLVQRSFKLTPLIEVTPGASEGLGLAGTPAQQWFLAQTDKTIDPVNVWDLAHDALASMPDAAAVEPDIEQQWLYENPAPLMLHDATFSADEVCRFNDQNERGRETPAGPEFGWFLRDDFSQLRSARAAVGNAAPVRIAHLDTGYDPEHVTRPQTLVAERNFVEDKQAGNDARDPSVRGVLRNPGHGPGTLSILAGNKLIGVAEAGPLLGEYLGGCPEAEIVPIRIANSVVLFRTSAFIKAVDYALRQGCQVLSMSMGGLASSAWADIVNQAYEKGLVMVTAAGNNFGGFPVSSIVYPARFQRVLAACGVMADGRPYHGLLATIMQGNVGPDEKMKTAMSAYTPNMPWAELGCEKIVDMDGQGTSAATPQIAAAAALWLMKHNPTYPQAWMRVEAVRKALFDSAQRGDEKLLGRGILRARDALDVLPADTNQLQKLPPDRASFPFLKLLTGLGAAQSSQAELLRTEASQLAQTRVVEDLIRAGADERRVIEAIAANPQCSKALKQALGEHSKQERPSVSVPAESADRGRATKQIAPPASRRLRTYAFDPSLSLDLDAKVINLTTVQIPWETSLQPGPVGEYVEVVDVDPSSACAYEPVDLNDNHLLAQDGHAPSEGNPQFHQQMVYAVAMRTIKNFENALGRVALWSPRRIMTKDGLRDQYVQRLRIYPHALRQPNAYYSSERKALLFGYFPASRTKPGRNLPGSTVFTCLSHDIVAHEMTHALLDGIHPRFSEPTNADVLALHEAFADIVALFQHFSFPEALLHQIRKTRGDLGKQSLLGELAQQFGEAIGQYGALRDAIGEKKDGIWRPKEPSAAEYEATLEPHKRGSILVAAVFEAFLAIYKLRVQDLIRIATGGSGVLPQGEIHPDLANRLAREAAETAQDVLTICIRALDYCPPVDITFGEYLRALVTADWDLSSTDDRGYRVAFIEAFRRRGIYPEGVRTLSEESLRWNPMGAEFAPLGDLLDNIDMQWDLYSNREEAFQKARENRTEFHGWIRRNLKELSPLLGLDPDPAVKFEVHSLRPARRTKYDSTMFTDLVVEVTQRKRLAYDDARPGDTFVFRGGCTVLLDVRKKAVRYVITKSITSQRRIARQREFLSSPGGASLHATYFGDPRRVGGERFALLHQGAFQEN